MQPVELLILAAGLGSRYGGDKQLDAFGPAGESLMEYALFDAKKAGFSKVVFVIRHELEELLAGKVLKPYRSWFEIDYVFQELSDLPPEAEPIEGRQRPWGTGHAVWTARNKLRHPFAVINADDYYGPEGFAQMAKFLRQVRPSEPEYALAAYHLKNTLSEHGTVSRGLVGAKDGQMTTLTECTQIGLKEGRILDLTQDRPVELSPHQPVSMNFWGFTPAVFRQLEAGFAEFLAQKANDPKAEFFITTPIDQAIRKGQARVSLLDCHEHWLGVTHPQDKALVVEGLRQKHQEGIYPRTLAP